MLIDQYRYYKENEDGMLVFWKCHEHFKSKCEAAVATMKKDKSRVVVLNDMHIHKHIQTRFKRPKWKVAFRDETDSRNPTDKYRKEQNQQTINK